LKDQQIETEMETEPSHQRLTGSGLTLVLSLALGILLLSGFTQSQPPAIPDQHEALASFETDLERLRQEMLIPGMSAAVVQDQELLWAKGFGYADPAQAILATADTPYHLASVTKPIGATVLMQLVEEGALSLDDPIANYGIHVESLGEVTVWHLLTHTSQGIPGLIHNYDGDRYALLDRVMTGATGRPFGQLLNERILTPLEMNHTAPNPTWGLEGFWASLGLGRDTGHYPAVYRGLAAPYQLNPEYNNVPGAYSLHFSPAAGLLSSVTDLAKFDIALDKDQLLDPATKEQMMTPAISTNGKPLIYGLGWYTQEYKETHLIWHSGGWSPSVSALILKAPDLDLTFIILANNYNLTGPYPMSQGDVLYSAPAMAFYKHLIFPKQFGKSVPAVDWTSDPDALLAQLEQIGDDDVRDVLERDLWAHRKMYAAAGRIELANQLGILATKAFPHSTLRYVPATRWVNTTLPAMSSVRATPKTIVRLGQLLLIWIVLTVVGLLLLVMNFARGSTLSRPFKEAWLLNTVFFGPLAALAFWISDRRPSQAVAMSGWRRAWGPAMFSVIGPVIYTVLGLYLYALYRPNSEISPAYLLGNLVVACLLTWFLLQTSLRARARGERYWIALRRTALLSIGTAVLATLVLLATGQLLSSNWLGDIPPDSPYFLLYAISGSLIAAVLIYPIQIWRIRRGRCYWPVYASGQSKPKLAVPSEARPVLDH
jgi:CubicO group peptidase (beta-lactamase class C family)